jgi:ankyrin repeat protein
MFGRRAFCYPRVTLLLAMGCVLVSQIPASANKAQLYDALVKGNSPRAIALLKKTPALMGSIIDDERQTPLHVAVWMNRTDVVSWLVAHKANVNAICYNGFTPLHLCETAQTARILIRGGADLDRKDVWGSTPLQQAAEYGHKPVVDAILKAGYKPDLRTAVQLKKRDLVKQMLKEQPALARHPTPGMSLGGSNTPLGLACAQKDIELVQLLLDAGADVNERTSMPNAGGDASALTNAVWVGDPEIVKLLLKRGAKTDVVGGKFYSTILEYARKNSTPGILKMLEAAAAESAPSQPLAH